MTISTTTIFIMISHGTQNNIKQEPIDVKQPIDIKQEQDTMRDIHHRLEQSIQNCFSSGDGWVQMKTKGGKTQKSERFYKTVVKDVIVMSGGKIVHEAGSQQKNDITVLWSNGQKIVYELKKKDSKKGNYMCNDSVPHENTVYIFINAGLQTVQICSNVTERLTNGMTLKNTENVVIDDIRRALDAVERDTNATNLLNLGQLVMTLISTNVSQGVISLFDFGQFFKRTYNFTTCTFRPRPNVMVHHNALV